MKQLFTSLILMISFISVASVSEAQVKTEQEVKSLLCNKWVLTHIEVEGEKSAVDEGQKDSYLVFKKDGSLSEIDGSGTTAAKWTYDHKSMTIVTEDNDEKQKYKLIKLTKTELVLQSDVDDMPINLIMKRVE